MLKKWWIAAAPAWWASAVFLNVLTANRYFDAGNSVTGYGFGLLAASSVLFCGFAVASAHHRLR